MNSVDVKCPICGAMNESLNLEETDGWMECESCGNAVQIMKYWTIYSWYCPNCRNEVAGLKNSKNQIRVKCKTCGSEMVRTIVGRRHDVIDIYAPSGQEHNDLELRRY